MAKIYTKNQAVIPLGIVGLLMFGLVLITHTIQFKKDPSLLSIAIILDFIITIPVIYYFLIQNLYIAKSTVFTVLFIGVFVASYSIPKENQLLLTIFKKIIYPIIELGLITYFLFKLKKTIGIYRINKNKNFDFFQTIKISISPLFPNRIGEILAAEIGIFYYGFLNWKRKIYSQNEFTYHIKTGNLALFYALIFIVLIEITSIHFILLKYSNTAAYVLSGLSIYTALQLFGLARSIPKRPIILTETTLFLTYGLLAETEINLDNIKEIKIIKKFDKKDKKIKLLSGLRQVENPNILISLKQKNNLKKLYGLNTEFSILALFVDEPAILISKITEKINNK